MSFALLAAALLMQDAEGFSEDQIKALNHQWAEIKLERQKERPDQPDRPPRAATSLRKAPRPALPPVGPIRPRPSYNKPRVPIVIIPPRPSGPWTVPTHVHR